MPTAAEAPLAPPAAEHELKYTLPGVRAAAVLDWLRGRCRPDSRYPDGTVSSVYFDSRGMRLLNQKVNSDFEKMKVRLRWYTDPASGEPTGPAFAEVKRKLGARRFKLRLPLDVPVAELARLRLHGARYAHFLDTLRESGVWLPNDLFPVMQIVFRRRRFLESVSGARISIDSDIHAPRVNPQLLPRANPFPLAHAVVEVKGPHRQLPGVLRPLTSLGCRKESFSKYARCYQKITRKSSF